MEKGQRSADECVFEIQGGCACGAVRFSATSDGEIAVCYCSMCRRVSGWTSIGWVGATVESLSVRGPVQEWRSSQEAVREHCGVCGSQLFMRYDAAPDYLDVAVGAIDNQDDMHLEGSRCDEEKPFWYSSNE